MYSMLSLLSENDMYDKYSDEPEEFYMFVMDAIYPMWRELGPCFETVVEYRAWADVWFTNIIEQIQTGEVAAPTYN